VPRPRTGSITKEINPTTGEVRYRVRGVVNGVRTTIAICDSPERAELAREVQLEGPPSSGAMTLRKWGRIWMLRRERDGIVRTWKNDSYKWKTHIDSAPFADRPMRRLRRQDVVRWVKDCLADSSRGTVLKALSLLRCSLRDAADEGRCPINAAQDVRVPKMPRAEDPHVFLSLDELDRLLTAERPHRALEVSRDLFEVMAFTALRPSELWRLRWKDVRLDGDRPELAVVGATKSTVHRYVPLLGPARAALRRLTRGIGNALVFPGKDGKPHCEGYDGAWSSWRKAAGVNPRARLYDLRHTCASHLLMGSGHGYPAEPWSMERVSAFLGHSDIKVTQKHYARFVPGWLDGPAAEARRVWEAGR
jgi:integrase